MKVRAARVLALALVPLALSGACRKKPAEVNDITASVTFNRPRAPLGSAIEVTYTWTTGPGFKPLKQDYRALSHFLDSHKVPLFTDDHVPVPPPSSWEANKTYTYQRTVFIPVYPYVGPAQVVMGLYPAAGGGERVAMKGEDVGLRAYKVASLELLPQTENIFPVYKEGWHSPESSPSNPSQERTWTKKEAVVSFKNPKKDVILYLEADTNYKAFSEPPVLTIAVNDKTGLVVPIENSEVFLKKVRFKAADLGSEDWFHLKLAMSQSFVPKNLNPPLNNDDRELGLLVYHLYVGEADKVGELPAREVVDAAALPPPSTRPGTKTPATVKGAPPATKPASSTQPGPGAKVTATPKPTPKA